MLILVIAQVGSTEISAVDVSSSDVPLLYDGCTIRVPVASFDKNLYFILDTGSTVSAVDNTYVSYLGDPIGQGVASTLARAKTVLTLYHCPSLLLGSFPLAIERVASIDLSTVQRISGSECDGILGSDFAEQHVLSIDLDKNIVHVSASPSAAVTHHSTSMPMLRVMGNHFGVRALVNGVPLRLMIDTGDNGSISLNEQDWDRVFSHTPKNEIHTTLAASISGVPIRMSAARVATLRVGPDTDFGAIAALAINRTAPSTLGLRFLRRYIATLDFKRQMLYLRPSSLFHERENADMSGLHLIRSTSQTIVYGVDESSPAEGAGLRPGDVIELVNGHKADELSIREIRRALKSYDGAVVSLSVKRDAQRSEMTFNLKTVL
jgi:predicted aspartyl protease